MADRAQVLASYRRWLEERWRKGRLTLEDVRALQVFGEVHALSADEHEALAAEVGVERRELVDENNQPVADWLRARRRPLPAGSGGLRFAPAKGAPLWKLRLPEPPPAWQSALAGLAAIVLVVAVIVAIVVH